MRLTGILFLSLLAALAVALPASGKKKATYRTGKYATGAHTSKSKRASLTLRKTKSGYKVTKLSIHTTLECPTSDGGTTKEPYLFTLKNIKAKNGKGVGFRFGFHVIKRPPPKAGHSRNLYELQGTWKSSKTVRVSLDFSHDTLDSTGNNQTQCTAGGLYNLKLK